MKWIKYSWEDKDSHPPIAGRYLIYRSKCDKMQFEQWNGNGWSSSNNDCTHWTTPHKPLRSVVGQSEQLSVAWKALEWVGFTKGEEFTDDDIQEMLNA